MREATKTLIAAG